LNIRRITRYFSLMIACLMVFGFTASAVDVINASSEFYVNDQSGILSDDNRAHILSTAAELDDLTGAQICVVTVDFLGGADIADYAYALFNDWGIGSATENNGVLLLVTIGEENYYLLQGKGLENVLSSGKLQTILDEDMEPDFAVGSYDAGIRKTYDSILNVLCEYYGVTVVGGSQQPGKGSYATSIVPDYEYESIPRQEESYVGAGFLGFGILIAVLVVFGLAIAVIVIVITSIGRSVSRGIGGSTVYRRTYDPYRNLHRRVPPPPPPGGFGRHYGGFGGMGGFGHRGGFGPRPGGFNSRPNSRPGGGFGSSRPGGSFGGSRSGGFSSSSRGGGRSGGFSGGGRSGGGGSSRGGGAGRR